MTRFVALCDSHKESGCLRRRCDYTRITSSKIVVKMYV